MPNPPYYIAVYGGFVVLENVPNGYQRLYTAPNIRLATPFSTFENADATAKFAVQRLYPPDLQYFALLQVAFD
jgi:hypothetical protein